MTRQAGFRETRIAMVLVLLLVGTVAMAADRVAQLSEVGGNVTITRVADQSVDEPSQSGPRVRNGSVFPGDVVATAADANATLLFSDGSEIKLRENTSLTVQEVDLAEMVKAGVESKPIGRRVQVLSGSVWTHIVSNPKIATAFETPSGVAAVKGTTFTITVGPSEEEDEEEVEQEQQ